MGAPDQNWYLRPSQEVARDLLGGTLRRATPQGVVTLRITEVEAYDGANDPGSHAFRGRTARNATMFGEPGRLYVYRHLGLHHCANVVCGPVGTPSAVLLRAGEVLTDDGGPDGRLGSAPGGGLALARARRRSAGVLRSDRDLARGPARLTVALDLAGNDDGADLTDPRGSVVLVPGERPGADDVVAGPRVGVGGAGGRGDLYPWRFWLRDELTVSAYRRATSRPRRAD